MKEAFKRGYLMGEDPIKQAFNHGFSLRDESIKQTFNGSYSTQDEPFKEELKHTYSMRDEPPPITVNPNEVYFGNTLGRGASGTVYRGRLGCEEVAIKIIRPQESVYEVGTEPLELYMGQSVSHPNLVKVLGVYVGGDRETDNTNEVMEQDMSIYESPPGIRRTSSSLFSDMAQDLSDAPTEIWIVMEYCNRGSLREAITAGEFFEDANRQRPRILHVLFAALEVAAALEHLHSFGIIHGDLKSQNVMLTTSQILAKNFVCKVGDFGMSRPLTQIKTHISTFTAGTVSHMPPEVLKDGILTPAVDVFSFGMLLWELMAGELPFMGLNSGETMVSIVEGQRPEIPSFCPPMFADLIRRCWNPQRELRPTFKEITRMLKTMLGGPPIPANKGIPAMNHQEMNSTVPTMSSELLFSEGETGTTFYGTTTDLSDNVCLSIAQDRPPPVQSEKPVPIQLDNPVPVITENPQPALQSENPTPVKSAKPESVQSEMPVLVESEKPAVEKAIPDLELQEATRVKHTSSPEAEPETSRSESMIPKPPRISVTHHVTDSCQSQPPLNGRRTKRTTPFPQWQAYLNAINESNKPLSRPSTKIPMSSSCSYSSASFTYGS